MQTIVYLIIQLFSLSCAFLLPPVVKLPICSPNEIAAHCAGCEGTCEQPRKRDCEIECQPAKCECDTARGFVRSAGGVCVPLSGCGAEDSEIDITDDFPTNAALYPLISRFAAGYRREPLAALSSATSSASGEESDGPTQRRHSPKVSVISGETDGFDDRSNSNVPHSRSHHLDDEPHSARPAASTKPTGQPSVPSTSSSKSSGTLESRVISGTVHRVSSPDAETLQMTARREKRDGGELGKYRGGPITPVDCYHCPKKNKGSVTLPPDETHSDPRVFEYES